MIKNLSILFISLLVILVALFVYPFYNPNNEKIDGKPQVSVTIYPIYDIVKNIGGDKISLHQIIPFGSEPHSFEPTPKDVIKIANSQLFIYTGEKVDLWAEDFTHLSPNSDKFLKLSNFVTIINHDPHFWQSIHNMKLIAKKITERLILLDPNSQELFNHNLENYLSNLDKLDNQFKSGLEKCQLHSIIVNHDAFNYLAKDYNFTSYAVMGLSPDDKPSAKAISDIIDIVKNQNVSTLFFEELASDSVIKTIAKETGVKISSLSPLGNVAPEQVNQGYIHLMLNNLIKLQEALHCQ